MGRRGVPGSWRVIGNYGQEVAVEPLAPEQDVQRLGLHRVLRVSIYLWELCRKPIAVQHDIAPQIISCGP
jgi:hypothetical protein